MIIDFPSRVENLNHRKQVLSHAVQGQHSPQASLGLLSSSLDSSLLDRKAVRVGGGGASLFAPTRENFINF
jgi:hypothetical protein